MMVAARVLFDVIPVGWIRMFEYNPFGYRYPGPFVGVIFFYNILLYDSVAWGVF